jgi:DNA-binding CsgD family transcriptional regulator
MAALGMLLASGPDLRFYVRVLPEIIRRILPTSTIGFFWADAKGEMMDAWCENAYFLSSEVVLSCQRYQEAAPENWPSFTENVMAGPVAGYLTSYQTPSFYASGHYAITYGRIDVRHVMDAVVHDGTRPHGCYLLMRSEQFGPFSEADTAIAADIARLTTLAFHSKAETSASTRSLNAGLLILSESGEIVHVDQEGHQSLWMLSRPATGGMPFGGEDRIDALADPVRQTALSLPLDAQTHQERRSSFWGDFTLQYDRMPEGRTIVRFHQDLPFEAHLARRLADGARSPRRVMVSWFLCKGLSRKEIAARLNLGQDTVNTYIAEAFAAERVRTALEFVTAILA